MQQSYLLSCPEGREARMLDAVERVDTAMCKIRDAGKIKARDRIAVLAALNLAFEVADRENAALVAAAAAATAQPTPVWTDTSGEPAHNAEQHAEQHARLAGLLQRLDASLGEDGRLL